MTGAWHDPAPGEEQATARSWPVIRAAFERREALPRAQGRARLLVAAATVVALVAASFSPPGLAVWHAVRRAIRVGGEPKAQPALAALPSAGRLLVNSASGPWVVDRDGSKRHLGPYRDAVWSPHGEYVAVARGTELLALTPTGDVRWSLARSKEVSLPSWNGPDGYRIAYLAGSDLHVVAGNQTGDRRLATGVEAVRPAWQPGPRHVLAFVDGAGAIRVVRADDNVLLWRSQRQQAPAQLAWSPDGSQLLALAPRRVVLFGAGGSLLWQQRLPPGTLALSAAFMPVGHRFAEILRESGQSEVLLPRSGRLLFSGPGVISALAWSPDGRWLLLAWRSADQLLFIRSGAVRRVQAAANVASEFTPAGGGVFPQIAGWCC